MYNSSLYAENTTFSQNAATAANLYNISIPAPAKNSDDALPGMTWCGTVGGVLPQDEIYGLTSPSGTAGPLVNEHLYASAPGKRHQWKPLLC